jgi:hypothetical protein
MAGMRLACLAAVSPFVTPALTLDRRFTCLAADALTKALANCGSLTRWSWRDSARLITGAAVGRGWPKPQRTADYGFV